MDHHLQEDRQGGLRQVPGGEGNGQRCGAERPSHRGPRSSAPRGRPHQQRASPIEEFLAGLRMLKCGCWLRQLSNELIIKRLRIGTFVGDLVTRDHLATWPSASVYQDRGHINVFAGESQFRHSLRLRQAVKTPSRTSRNADLEAGLEASSS
jgi:hypothetical protein